MPKTPTTKVPHTRSYSRRLERTRRMMGNHVAHTEEEVAAWTPAWEWRPPLASRARPKWQTAAWVSTWNSDAGWGPTEPNAWGPLPTSGAGNNETR
ncbi:hypothetical protein C8R47DRAFT_1214047 [Mycena vitilis]|nr:hypothetical protein C8R47DRAFT_1214047 [Mycena vitilis]